MDEIRRRTQGSQEKVLTYITIMENLFRKLQQPPSESERVTLIKRNLLPSIQSQLALQRVLTIDELVRLSRAVEETAAVIQKYVPPSTSSRSLLEPELAYKKPAGQSSIAAVRSQPSQSPSNLVENRNPRQSPVAPDQSPACWNCGKTGHRFNKCEQPRRTKFCFKCGESNVSVYNCPRCRKNLNRSQQ